MTTDVEAIAKQALEELDEERQGKLKIAIKASLREVQDARTVYENAQRRHADLMAQLSEGIDTEETA